jgi:hypothetical protein
MVEGQVDSVLSKKGVNIHRAEEKWETKGGLILQDRRSTLITKGWVRV